jgi:hypothetical protein
VFFNAWEADGSSDPMLAFATELETKLPPMPDATSALTALGARVFRKGVGRTAELVTLRILREEDFVGGARPLDAGSSEGVAKARIAAFEAEHAAVAEFRAHLKGRAQVLAADAELRSPLVVFIDELDRCRPSFAVELLERIKHLFDVPGIVFVLGLHRAELAHSVCAVYGGGFDGEKYLDRFFDMTYALPVPNIEAFVSWLTLQAGWDKNHRPLDLANEDVDQGIALLASDLDFSLRDVEQAVAELDVLLRLAPPTLNECHAPTLIFLAMLRRGAPKAFNQFLVRESSPDDIIAIHGAAFRLSDCGLFAHAGLLLCDPESRESRRIRDRMGNDSFAKADRDDQLALRMRSLIEQMLTENRNSRKMVLGLPIIFDLVYRSDRVSLYPNGN